MLGPAFSRQLLRFTSSKPASCRWFADAADTSVPKKPSLKSLLMRFYLMVHPDVFSAHPTEKDVNARSFQLLQSVLDDFKEKRSSGPPTIHRLEFFYKPRPKPPTHDGQQKPDLGAEGEQAMRLARAVGAGDAGNLQKALGSAMQKVSVSLKSFSGREDFIVQRRELENSLGKLFTTCGLNEDGFDSSKFLGDNSGGGGVAGSVDESDDLMSFLNEHAIIARERINIAQTGSRSADLVATCLYIQNRLRVVFELPTQVLEDGVTLPFTVRLHLLQKFQSLLEETARTPEGEALLDNVRGMTVVFADTPSEIDGSGRLCLHYKDNANWRALMKTVNPEHVMALRSIHKQRQEHESALASKLGIAAIYADYDGQNSPEYLAQLLRLEQAVDAGFFGPRTADGAGPFAESLPDLKIRISRSLHSVQSDEEHGVLFVPFDVSLAMLRATIVEQGPKAVAKHRAIKQENHKLHQLVTDVKRRFRIFRLSWDMTLSNAQISVCCSRLLLFQDDLVPFLGSVSVKIAREYGLEDDGTLVLKWDFDMPRRPRDPSSARE